MKNKTFSPTLNGKFYDGALFRNQNLHENILKKTP